MLKFYKSIIYLIILFSSLIATSQKLLSANPSIGFYGGPLFHLFNIKPNSLYNSDYSQDFSCEVGGFISNKFFSQKKVSLDINIGCNWNNKKYRQTFNYNSQQKGVVCTEFSYINLPFTINLFLNRFKVFKPYISAGYVFGILKKEYRQTNYENGEVNIGFGGNVTNYPRPGYLNFAIGSQIKLNNYLSASIEPYFKYCIIGNSSPSQDRTVIKSLGLRIGLVLKLPDFKLYNKI